MGAFRWLGSSLTDEIVIRPFDGRIPAAPTVDLRTHPDYRLAVVLDTETTGLDHTRDRVIEFGGRSIVYSRSTGEVVGLLDTYDALQDPGAPLSEKISKLTGLTDADLAGQSIDAGRVRSMIERAHVVIAHNAGFDRPFVDRMLAAASPAPPPRVAWACSIELIDWAARGLPSTKLEALCAMHGFYSQSHRAGSDAAALVRLLAHRNAETGRTYLAELLEAARTPSVRVAAIRSPFERKDALKERGYSWVAMRKVWERTVPSAERDAELAWLRAEIYGAGSCPAVATPIEPADRYAAAV